jgi:hypothetical protein
MMESDEEIMDQHKKLFQVLEKEILLQGVIITNG